MPFGNLYHDLGIISSRLVSLPPIVFLLKLHQRIVTINYIGCVQDAQEFLVCLLDRLHCELTSANGKNGNNNKAASQSIISETFYGSLESQVTCKKCGKSSNKLEPFLGAYHC